MIAILKERLGRLPLRATLIFFGTLLIIGYYRRGSLAALWIFGWAAYMATKLVFTVKRKVDQQTKLNNQRS